jgi:hypothetical protein
MMCVSIVIAYLIDESTGYPAYKQKFIQGSFVSEAKDSLENNTKVRTIVALVNKRHRKAHHHFIVQIRQFVSAAKAAIRAQ